MPSKIPPTGRMKKPTPNVAVVSKSEAYWLSLGKNNFAMITVKKPNTRKSYHSSALPITAAAIWKGFSAGCMVDIGSPSAFPGAREEKEFVRSATGIHGTFSDLLRKR